MHFGLGNSAVGIPGTSISGLAASKSHAFRAKWRHGEV